MTPSQAGTLDATHAVLTPEYVEFDFVLAGLYSRFLAWLIDALIVFTASMVAFFLIFIPLQLVEGIAAFLFVVVYFLIDWGYGITLETWWSGQTVGKRVMGLRV
ncbi:MAG: RDD family protein, partial [Myxococcaceae bacterium]